MCVYISFPWTETKFYYSFHQKHDKSNTMWFPIGPWKAICFFLVFSQTCSFRALMAVQVRGLAALNLLCWRDQVERPWRDKRDTKELQGCPSPVIWLSPTPTPDKWVKEASSDDSSPNHFWPQPHEWLLGWNGLPKMLLNLWPQTKTGIKDYCGY
jgi:hypothetical protein